MSEEKDKVRSYEEGEREEIQRVLDRARKKAKQPQTFNTYIDEGTNLTKKQLKQIKKLRKLEKKYGRK